MILIFFDLKNKIRLKINKGLTHPFPKAMEGKDADELFFIKNELCKYVVKEFETTVYIFIKAK